MSRIPRGKAAILKVLTLVCLLWCSVAQRAGLSQTIMPGTEECYCNGRYINVPDGTNCVTYCGGGGARYYPQPQPQYNPIPGLENQLNSLRAQNSQLRGEVSDLQGKHLQLENQVRELNDQVTSLQNEIDKMNRENQEYEKLIFSLQKGGALSHLRGAGNAGTIDDHAGGLKGIGSRSESAATVPTSWKQLSCSADIGKNAMEAAEGGDVYGAWYLAGQSGSAMNGGAVEVQCDTTLLPPPQFKSRLALEIERFQQKLILGLKTRLEKSKQIDAKVDAAKKKVADLKEKKDDLADQKKELVEKLKTKPGDRQIERKKKIEEIEKKQKDLEKEDDGALEALREAQKRQNEINSENSNWFKKADGAETRIEKNPSTINSLESKF